MEPEYIKQLIESHIPDATAEVIDATGSKDHFSAVVISPSFSGKSLVEQHQLVYKAVEDFMTREIHALQLKTYSTEQWKNDKK